MISHRASRLTNDAEKAIAVKALAMHRSCGPRLYVGDDDAGNFAGRTQDECRASKRCALLPRARFLEKRNQFYMNEKTYTNPRRCQSRLLLAIKISSCTSRRRMSDLCESCRRSTSSLSTLTRFMQFKSDKFSIITFATCFFVSVFSLF